jgi:glycosyltransferase involved in cell wall biosynthesis
MSSRLNRSMERIREILRPFYLRWLYFPLFPARRPRHFSDSWTFPTHDIDKGLKLDPPAGAEGPLELLFLPMTDWHTRIQRTQHLARTFASTGVRCFYLNPHLGREFPRPYLFSDAPKLSLLEPLISELHVHLPLEPVFHDRMLSQTESSLIADTLKKLFNTCGTKKLVQIVSFPVWAEAARLIRDTFQFPIVYDCHDVLSGFRNISKDIVDSEAALMEASDLVLFSSRELLNENRARYPFLKSKSLLVRNAVDESWLRQSEAIGRAHAADGAVTIGYVGALDFWFDVQAVELAARRHPEWRFILVGRVEDKRILKLGRLPNVRFVGEVPHSDLHPHMAAFHVATIPFLRNDLTMGTNPIKLYEYFSYGLPVVSARLPEMEEFGPLVYLSEDAEAFVRQLETAVAEKGEELREQRIRMAHRESWDARVAQLKEAFQELLTVRQ